MKYKIFSFFSGSGFLDLGFEANEFEVVFVNEFSPAFLSAYQYSRKHLKIKPPQYGCHNTDVRSYLNINAEELDGYVKDARKDGSLVIFIGGPPCPDFSVAGKQKGKDGKNGKLTQVYTDLILRFQPEAFLFENVKGLWRTTKHRAFYEEIKEMLHSAGYATTDRLTNALEYGTPQDRDRILLFGIKKSILTQSGYSKNALLNFPWEKYQKYSVETIKRLPWQNTTPFRENSNTECPQSIPIELTVQYWFKKNDVENHPDGQRFLVPRAGLSKMQSIQEGDTGRKSYKRLHRWRYSPTCAYGNNEVHLHPYKARRISVAEALALQSMPKEFSLPPDMPLTAAFKTIGNGVPYLMASGIAKTIFDYLKKEVGDNDYEDC